MLTEIDLSRADLNLLLLFDAVYEERHLGKAAERLNLTPSAVSHGLGRLRALLNDPLFLRTPKGVSPTARASEFAVSVAHALAQVRNVISTATPFDPATSTRRFAIGAPDSAAAVILPPLLENLRKTAPGIAISVRQLLPTQGEGISPEHAWRSAFVDLDARALDIAIIPYDAIPERFLKRRLYDEDLVIGMRAEHPFAKEPTLEKYCATQHLVVSATGDPFGFVDRALAEKHLTRHTALTVPNFMFALAVLAETDLLCALPRRFAERHATTFGVVTRDPPLPLEKFRVNGVAPKPAMTDSDLAWLFDILCGPGEVDQ